MKNFKTHKNVSDTQEYSFKAGQIVLLIDAIFIMTFKL